MKFNSNCYIFLAVVVIESSCNADPSLSKRMTRSLEGFEAWSLKRAPLFNFDFSTGFSLGNKKTTPNNQGRVNDDRNSPSKQDSGKDWVTNFVYGPRFGVSSTVPKTSRSELISTTQTIPTVVPTIKTEMDKKLLWDYTDNPVSRCVLPEQPIGGDYEVVHCGETCNRNQGSRVPVGSGLKYRCKEGYTFRGENVSYCTNLNTWSIPNHPTCVKCGIEISREVSLIFNGLPGKHGSFPWHVGIYETQTNGFRNQICGGSLISPRLVISAAHCFFDDSTLTTKNASYFTVAAGKYYRSYDWPEKFAQQSPVKQIVLRSRFSGFIGNYAEDIALIRVWTPFNLTNLVRPVCIDWENTFVREHLRRWRVGKVSGWGKTADGNSSVGLQEINVPYVSFNTCIRVVPRDFRGFITPDKFCAGYTNGSSLCNGDSGGGLVSQINDIWYLRGIVSVMPVMEEMCENQYYTAFTNVGKFREWIREVFSNPY